MKNTSIKHKEKIFFSYDERQEFLEKNKKRVDKVWELSYTLFSFKQ